MYIFLWSNDSNDPNDPKKTGSKWSDTFSASPTAKIKKSTWKLSRHEKETKGSGTPKKPHIFCGGSSKTLPDLYWSPAQLGSGSCLTSKKIKAMRNLKSKSRQNRPPLGYVFHGLKKTQCYTLLPHERPTQLTGILSEKHWQHRDDEDVVLKKESAKVNTVSGIFG